jgi:uncharacterized protein YhaN
MSVFRFLHSSDLHLGRAFGFYPEGIRHRFAFASVGYAVPVILDDALVHSDDGRIEAMFDALHRTARDQQILVLTCRHRAFSVLGGERAEVVVEGI